MRAVHRGERHLADREAHRVELPEDLRERRRDRPVDDDLAEVRAVVEAVVARREDPEREAPHRAAAVPLTGGLELVRLRAGELRNARPRLRGCGGARRDGNRQQSGENDCREDLHRGPWCHASAAVVAHAPSAAAGTFPAASFALILIALTAPVAPASSMNPTTSIA